VKATLTEEKQRLIKLLAQGTIGKDDFETAMTAVGTELTQVESAIPNAGVAEQDLSNLLAFAEWLLERVAGIWNSATGPNKQRLQAALFRGGLTVSKDGFGTAQDPLFFTGYLDVQQAN
jgi:hypothetical protein